MVARAGKADVTQCENAVLQEPGESVAGVDAS